MLSLPSVKATLHLMSFQTPLNYKQIDKTVVNNYYMKNLKSTS